MYRIAVYRIAVYRIAVCRIAKISLLLLAATLVWAQDDRPRLRPLNDQSANHKTGPAVGSRIPDFEAIDLAGKRQTFNSLKGPRGLVLVFARSADWCPYCKTQLADVNRQVEGFRKQGLNVASLTYDTREILQEFSTRIGIKYTMLSDPESKIIRAFDILNTNIPQDNKARYGIPFPGTYIINEKGIVTAKYFDDDYRERSSAASILTREFGAGGVAKNVVENTQIKLTYYAADATLGPGHRTTLVLEIEPKPTMHLYAPGVERYIPIDWQMTGSPAWIAFPVSYPTSRMLNLPVIKETVPVYDRKFKIVRDLAVGLDPELKPALSADRTLTVEGAFRYQACDDKECYLPKTIPLKWTFQVGQLDTQRVSENLQRK
jgi:peroxiredoxin